MNKILAISDTNIFIDLLSVDLLEAFFNLPIEIVTTDFVVKEIIDRTQKAKIERLINSKKLKVKTSSENELAEIISIYENKGNNVSIVDCSVWYYAKKFSDKIAHRRKLQFSRCAISFA